MSARDIVRNVLLDERDIDGCLHLSDSILEALTSAGYRILAPGEMDRETLEAAAKVVESLPAEGREGVPGVPWTGWTDEEYRHHTEAQDRAKAKAAAAIRALGGGEG